ncbi:MAG: tRNA lysidine(34) synthetase TilS [Anaerolineaceae bacterium]
MIAERILSSLRADCRWDASKPLVVGVSGGADSLTLAHCLQKAGVLFTAAHLDHSLRATSAEEAERVRVLFASWGLPCLVERADVRSYAKVHKLGIEEAARQCRYRFLFRLAEESGAQAVAVGHTADDQVETVLMHFLRGSGINGLRGIQARSILAEFHAGLPVFRPMLGISRAETEAYCRENQLAYIVDASNADKSYFRNRLRHEIIPSLEAANPAFRRVILRNARALQSDAELLEDLEEQALRACLREQNADQLVLDADAFGGLRVGLQRRVLIQSVLRLRPGLRDIGLEALDRALENLQAGKTRFDLVGNLEVMNQQGTLVLIPKGFQPALPQYPQLARAERFTLNPGEALGLAQGWGLRAEILSAKAYKKVSAQERRSPEHAWLNPADLSLPLEVRAARVGERWSPLGMPGKTQKLSDFFVNQKIPQPARALWPLVFCEGSLLWVAGLRIAQAWRLQGDEPEVLHLSLHKPC